MKHLLLIALLSSVVSVISAQEPDSLRRGVHNEALTDSARLEYLKKLARYHLYRHPDSTVHYCQIIKTLAERIRDTSSLGSAYNLEGGALTIMGRFVDAMDQFSRSLDIRKAYKDTLAIASTYNNIGNVYYYKGDFPRALHNYIASSELEEAYGGQAGLAGSLLNIGSVYGDQDDSKQALKYFQAARDIYQSLGDTVGVANVGVNIGLVYMVLDSLHAAQEYLEHSVRILRNVTANNHIAAAYMNLAKVYLIQGDTEQSFSYYQKAEELLETINDPVQHASLYVKRGSAYLSINSYARARADCSRALSMAEELGILPEMQQSCNCLYMAYKGLGQNDEALIYYERLNALTDSMELDETRKQLQIHEFRQEVARDSMAREDEKRRVEEAHALEVRKVSRRRNVYLISGIFLLVMSILLFRTVQKTRKSKQQIEDEKSRADKLLLNVLPESIAQELLKTGKVDAREFEEVAVLFTDFIGFTETVRDVPGKILVEGLHEIFRAFDEIIARYGIQKIKTIGDAYLVAGGLPVSSLKTITHTVDAALEMQTYLEEHRATSSRAGSPSYAMRAGIHLGPVTAGIVGEHNFQYDIWGNTVNIASRLQSRGEQGKVAISSDVYEMINTDPRYKFIHCGPQRLKGVGDMEMWFVERG